MKSTRPLKAGKQFIWKEAVLGLNSGNEVEEYLESAQEPKGLISISSVN
jgi:glycerol-3-phosphate responsive antiterminator